MPKNNANFFKTKNSWSEIKDRLLGCYLPQYFQKLLMSRNPIFYVDCFAGKGKFEDGNDGSPRIALQVRQRSLAQTRAHTPNIETCFIDLNYANELRGNISEFSADGMIEVVSGRYEEKISELLSTKRNYNVFLYIDPYGIQALDFEMVGGFTDRGFPSIELLINMNSFGFFRDACRVMSVSKVNTDEAFRDLESELVEYDPADVNETDQPKQLLTSIAGGDYWKNIVCDYKDGKINGYQAESRFSTEYRQRLRTKYKYVLDMPIRLKKEQRPKYRMIHATQHHDGCFLMAQNMQSRKDELFTNIQDGGQMSLFDLDSSMTRNVDGEYITTDEIRQKLTAHLKRVSSPIRLNPFLADFVNEYGVLCEFKILQTILTDLKNGGQIAIDRVPATNQRGASAFWDDGKNAHTVTIRRLQP